MPVGGGLARSAGRHAAWGALFVLWPGFAYSLSLDTSELLAGAPDAALAQRLRDRLAAIAVPVAFHFSAAATPP